MKECFKCGKIKVVTLTKEEIWFLEELGEFSLEFERFYCTSCGSHFSIDELNSKLGGKCEV